ncbi:hypothetical protein [Kordiimonas sp.]|uniref:hypothetical protein n=1 Tax=Kordiimonas sp. TaxID=1970157 RepID=UPI003A9500E3
MADTEKTMSEEQLKTLLTTVSQDRFAPFFEQRVMAAIRQEEETAGTDLTEQFAEFLSVGFKRLAMPVAAACLMVAAFNLQSATPDTVGTSVSLVEAAFGIPTAGLDAALTPDFALKP